MRSLALLLLPLIAACNAATPISDDDDAQDSYHSEAERLVPDAQPVQIGEGGSRFEACSARGTVVDVPPGSSLPIRIAPFSSAAEAGSLTNGQRLFVCTRSIDQRWLGVVVMPPTAEGAPADDCGLSVRVESTRGYDGSCKSGWVSSALVRLFAG